MPFSFLRPLLFQTPEDIVNNPSLGESLPFSVVLHYLFSRAPIELKYPHEVQLQYFRYFPRWLLGLSLSRLLSGLHFIWCRP